ncbi:MAG TPA: DUF5684 domain-containing protein [Rariglobus sp.]
MIPAIALLIELAIFFVVIAGIWKVFTKAGQPGWASLIPFYNVYILTRIVGKPGWWLLLFLIPIVNIVIAIILAVELAKAFGKGVGFGVGLAFLGVVFYPILGFGDSTYQGPASA